jgi:hypothetical protein
MHDSIGGDLLRGAQAIADFVGLKVRDAFDKLEKGYLPATKEGHLWVASKSALRALSRPADHLLRHELRRHGRPRGSAADT